MGTCDSICQTNKANVTKQVCFPSNVKPISENEMVTLFSYESALCKIKVKIEKEEEELENLSEIYEGKEREKEEILIGTGFFCEINDDNIPFKKALFTNNHVLNESYIKNNKIIE